MFVVSYCHIYWFYPALNLDKIVIFRSFQQTSEKLYDLSHFKEDNIPFFNKTTFYQLKDATFAVLACKNSTSFAELFLVELKFTVDTLNDWFASTIKPKYLEPNDIKNQIFTKENPIISAKTICFMCRFLLDVKEGGWYETLK